MLPLFRLKPYWEVSPGDAPYMDSAKRTKSKERAVFWTQQPQTPPSLLPADVPGGSPELGMETSLQGPACWNGPSGTTAEEEAGEKLGQFFALL